jgi:hypothetical protein
VFVRRRALVTVPAHEIEVVALSSSGHTGASQRNESGSSVRAIVLIDRRNKPMHEFGIPENTSGQFSKPFNYWTEMLISLPEIVIVPLVKELWAMSCAP